MSDWRLHSTKYDGSLHYRYPLQLIHESPERLITFYEPGPPVESYRGNWNGKNNLLSYFWRRRPYVLHVLWDTQWQPTHLYVDIATGTDWANGTVRYIDLDLDLILRHGSTNVELDDENEFETHRRRWNYPEPLVKECWAAVDEVRRFFKAADEPFAALDIRVAAGEVRAAESRRHHIAGGRMEFVIHHDP